MDYQVPLSIPEQIEVLELLDLALNRLAKLEAQAAAPALLDDLERRLRF